MTPPIFMNLLKYCKKNNRNQLKTAMRIQTFINILICFIWRLSVHITAIYLILHLLGRVLLLQVPFQLLKVGNQIWDSTLGKNLELLLPFRTMYCSNTNLPLFFVFLGIYVESTIYYRISTALIELLVKHVYYF